MLAKFEVRSVRRFNNDVHDLIDLTGVLRTDSHTSHTWNKNIISAVRPFTLCSLGGHDKTGWPLTGEPGKHGKVREFKSGQGKVRESVFLHMVNYREY